MVIAGIVMTGPPWFFAAILTTTVASLALRYLRTDDENEPDEVDPEQATALLAQFSETFEPELSAQQDADERERLAKAHAEKSRREPS
jgi:hypothetical protein